MFRKMRRFKQEMPAEECRELLKTQVRGVLSLLGDDGYPYGLPIDYWYNEADGKLYFHGAKEGHKIDAIRACDKASFCIHDEGVRMDGRTPVEIRSISAEAGVLPRVHGSALFQRGETQILGKGVGGCRHGLILSGAVTCPDQHLTRPARGTP